MFELLKDGPYVCIHCGYPDNEYVYKAHGNAIKYHSRSPSSTPPDSLDTKKQPRLTKCPKCSKFVDDYVQMDYNILYLDALLQKRTFYRHILLNCRINSNKSALKMALIFYFCDAFQRWTTSNGVTFTSEKNHSDSPTSSLSSSPTLSTMSRTYFQLEMSFYYNFLCAILENLLFNLIFYYNFKMFIMILCRWKLDGFNPPPSSTRTMREIFMSLVICSYGKLFLIPLNLYGGDLKPILEAFIQIFYISSLIQCTMVKSSSIVDWSKKMDDEKPHSLLNVYHSCFLILVTYLMHYFLVTFFHWLSLLNIINKLQHFL